jgi:hypothetical protein
MSCSGRLPFRANGSTTVSQPEQATLRLNRTADLSHRKTSCSVIGCPAENLRFPSVLILSPKFLGGGLAQDGNPNRPIRVVTRSIITVD